MEEVKIIYCYDETGAATHYSKTNKGNKYTCIDCGSELICKDGEKNIKHLAHKNTENCGGTGESIFHKHWKENLFKAGMYINIANRISEPDNVEILEVLNEVSLNKRYNKSWRKEIIVDVLLVTEKGDIVIEINYKNPKNWSKLEKYYGELNILRVYEVTVDKNINSTLKWFCLGEEEEIRIQEVEQRKREIEAQIVKERLKEEKKKEKKRLKEEVEKAKMNHEREMLKNGTYKGCDIYFNFKNELKYIDEDNYSLLCLMETSLNKYEKINLKFNLKEIGLTKNKLNKILKTSYGIKYCYVVIDTNQTPEEFYRVVRVGEYTFMEENNKRLYAQLCNLN